MSTNIESSRLEQKHEGSLFASLAIHCEPSDVTLAFISERLLHEGSVSPGHRAFFRVRIERANPTTNPTWAGS